MGTRMTPPCELLQRVRAACHRHADRVALDSARHPLTYAQLGQAIDQQARALGPDSAGQRILLRVARSPNELAVLFFACLAAGAVPALADPVWTEAECRALARRVGCTRWIGDQPWPGDEPLAAPPGSVPLYQQALPPDEAVPPAPLHPDCAFIRFSSGSTGLPRAIEFSAAGAVAIADAWAGAAGLGAGDRVLCYATLNNGLAFNTSLLPGLLAGAHLRFEAAFLTARSVLAVAREFQPTVFVAFPLVYEFVAGRPAPEVAPALGGTRLRLSSASALGATTKALWCDRHGLPIGNYYGIAEVGPVTFNDGADQAGMGRVLAAVQLRLPDAEAQADDAAPVPATIVTPWMALGYLADPARSAAGGLRGGQPYPVGDRLARDADGRLQLRGRHDDVLNLNGKKVALGSLRDSLAQVLGDTEFAVVPVHEDSGAHIALHLEAPRLSTQAVQDACARVLPAHALPRRIVVHERFPRSSAGKVLLGQLQQAPVHPRPPQPVPVAP